MPKARVIHMDRIRLDRDLELAELDVLSAQAAVAGDVAEELRIADLKRTLRGIPQTFDLEAYTTPEGLNAAWPTDAPRMEKTT